MFDKMVPWEMDTRYPIPMYGLEMATFVLDEVELGTRVACCLDSENNAGWSALDDLSYAEWESNR